MTKKYTYLVHIALFLAAMILLCLGFFLETPNGGLITEQRAMPTCKEVQEVAEETRSDAAAPQGVTREFHFTLDNNLTEKQLMFYVINSNTKVYINGELVFDKHRIETNKVSATGCYWVNLTLLRADSGKEVTVELQPLYAATVKRAVTFYEGSQYPLFWKILKQDAAFCFFGIFLILFGIIYLGIAFHYRVKMQIRLNLSALGMVSVLVGCWKISDTCLIAWLVPAHVRFFSYLSSIAVLLLPLFVTMYINISARPHSTIQRAMYGLMIGNAVLAAIAGLLHLLRITALRESQGMFVYLILAEATFLTVLEFIIYHRHRNDMRHKLFMASVICLMLSILLDVLCFLIWHSSNLLFFTMIGIVVYIVAIGILTLRNAQDKLFRDKATGLYNRNKCNELIHMGIAPDDRLCFMMFDLNGLKKTNDNCGHDAGDQMIAKFAEVLRNSIPAGNFIGRSGGDEFISIIYNTDEERVKKIIADMREQITAFNQENEHGAWQLGAAVGYAFVKEVGSRSYKDLYELADKRMYENKRAMKAVRTE